MYVTRMQARETVLLLLLLIIIIIIIMIIIKIKAEKWETGREGGG